jgi:hypothetical protein
VFHAPTPASPRASGFSLINDKLRTIPDVRTTETFIYVSLRKQTYTWGAH